MNQSEFKQFEEAIEEITNIAENEKLDFFPMRYEVCPADVLYSIGAYGMPTRFSHWSFGKTYQKMKMSYDFNMSKIYELVVNSDPCYAFFLENNNLLQNKLIVAHVLGHSDFFKNNVYFGKTNRGMIDTMSLYAEQIRNMEFAYGVEKVEEFIDAVLSIQEHIDPSLESYEEREEYKDILLYILKNNPYLEEWQQQIINIMREEMLYFYPQIQTKIMNEGWATFWHLEFMRKLELTESEIIEYSKMNASVIQGSPTQLNPYLMGLKIFEELDKKHGREFIFEVRELDNDVSFIRNYLTEDVVRNMDLYTFGKQNSNYYVTSKDVEQIRDILVKQRTNGGFPYIVVKDGDYLQNRELYLKHKFEGLELDTKYIKHTLPNVYKLWGRGVHIETIIENKKILFSYNGKEIVSKYI